MKDTAVEVVRKTKETDIRVVLELDGDGKTDLTIGVPFFEHLLQSMAFHGGFDLKIQATGDIDVDPHHLVEDVGLVLGDAFYKATVNRQPLSRFGHAVIPMDDALSEVVVDVCERPFLVYKTAFPQPRAGAFDLYLIREFFHAFVSRSKINLHLNTRYGENSHHMAEALFKALGRALHQAYKPTIDKKKTLSTKGMLK